VIVSLSTSKANCCTNSSQVEKRLLLGYNKNYATLALDWMLKNSKGTISVSGMCKYY